jgi:hypothetical protein
MLRPNLAEPNAARISLSRDGKAKTYKELARGLDPIVAKYAAASSSQAPEAIRTRVGKDIDRLTRSTPPAASIKYTAEELLQLTELAAVLRLDKARVPKATKYIRRTVTGQLSFSELFAKKKKYAGAGKGGVKLLRGKEEDAGELSEGSDIEDASTTQTIARAPTKRPRDNSDLGRKLALISE